MKRIQRQRTKGWRMPEGAIYVGRPTRWGNPFDLRYYPLDRALALYRETLYGGWNPTLVAEYPDWLADQTYQTAKGWQARLPHAALIARTDLRGHDLACWCPLEDAAGNRVPCHADVLLELANE